MTDRPVRAATVELRLSEQRDTRYTSYPTELELTARVGPQQIVAEIRQTHQEPVPAPLSLYLHLPAQERVDRGDQASRQKTLDCGDG